MTKSKDLKSENTSVITTNPTNIVNKNFNFFDESVIDEIIKASAVTGIKNRGTFFILAQRAKELNIGMANAFSHMYSIKDKIGIDIHIIRSIIQRPGSGIKVELIKDYEPVYKYTDGNNIFEYDNLPPNYIVLPKLSNNPDTDKYRELGKYPVTFLPTIETINGKKVKKLVPVDYATEYKFTRKKRDIDGSWITETVISRFTWNDALVAQLPLDKMGKINPDSAWYKYRKLMMKIRAYKFGATEIAGDLIMGNSEITEILDTEKINYEIDPQTETITINDDDIN
jgi:hypothetical protein